MTEPMPTRDFPYHLGQMPNLQQQRRSGQPPSCDDFNKTIFELFCLFGGFKITEPRPTRDLPLAKHGQPEVWPTAIVRRFCMGGRCSEAFEREHRMRLNPAELSAERWSLEWRRTVRHGSMRHHLPRHPGRCLREAIRKCSRQLCDPHPDPRLKKKRATECNGQVMSNSEVGHANYWDTSDEHAPHFTK